jgi:glycine oxidase
MKAGIAGGGILGRLLALTLKNAGWDVSLFDQGGEDNCSQTAAGLLTPVTELEKNDFVIYELGKEAITQHWPSLLKQLEKNIFFQQTGSLMLSHSRDQTELIRSIEFITNKLGKVNNYQRLNQDQIKKLEPELTKFQDGYYFPEEGQLDCQAILGALKNKLTAEIDWYENTVVHGIRPREILLQDRVVKVDVVFDCRGLGAKSIFSDLRGVRGELIWLHAPDVKIKRPIRLIHPRYSLYIVPRPNECYIIGATEIESSDTSAISVRSVLELLTAAYSVHPGFCEARIIKMITQCRPTLTNHLPKIKYTTGFIAINGLYRHGYLIAPSLVADVMRSLEQGMQQVRYPQLWEKYL